MCADIVQNELKEITKIKVRIQIEETDRHSNGEIRYAFASDKISLPNCSYAIKIESNETADENPQNIVEQ